MNYMEDMTSRLARLGEELVELNEEAREIEERKAIIKDEIASLLAKQNCEVLSVPLGDREFLKFKINKRCAKRFDKDSLAEKLGVTRQDLDYPGLAKFVETKLIDAASVAQFQKDNNYEFVTVMKGHIMKGKKSNGNDGI